MVGRKMAGVHCRVVAVEAGTVVDAVGEDSLGRHMEIVRVVEVGRKRVRVGCKDYVVVEGCDVADLHTHRHRNSLDSTCPVCSRQEVDCWMDF